MAKRDSLASQNAGNVAVDDQGVASKDDRKTSDASASFAIIERINSFARLARVKSEKFHKNMTQTQAKTLVYVWISFILALIPCVLWGLVDVGSGKVVRGKHAWTKFPVFMVLYVFLFPVIYSLGIIGVTVNVGRIGSEEGMPVATLWGNVAKRGSITAIVCSGLLSLAVYISISEAKEAFPAPYGGVVMIGSVFAVHGAAMSLIACLTVTKEFRFRAKVLTLINLTTASFLPDGQLHAFLDTLSRRRRQACRPLCMAGSLCGSSRCCISAM